MWKKIRTAWGKVLKQEKGFTLMEMMIVVSIIAILTAIAIPKFSNSLAVANTAKVKSDLHTIETAAGLYYNQKGEYPQSLDALGEYLDVDKLSHPSGKVLIKGVMTEIKDGDTYSYSSANGARFAGKSVEDFSSK